MKTVNERNGLIVVGVDSSEGAKAALRLRTRGGEAAAGDACASSMPGSSATSAITGIEGFSPVVGADLGDLRRTAEVALDAVMHEVVPDADGVVIERRVVEGAPATVLVDESRHADLLVVGSRGHGGFAGLLLGSVSQQCAHHAACPVVIVRAKAKEADVGGRASQARLRAGSGRRRLPRPDRPHLAARRIAGASAPRRVGARARAEQRARRWFGHDPARFAEFRRRYESELAAQEEKLRELRRHARKGTLTLVYGARDTEHNDAVVLADVLDVEPGGAGQ